MEKDVDRLSAHFRRSKLACRCCGKLELHPDLVPALEALRHAAGDVPVQVKSGYRCPKHNAEVGGAKHSYHLKGMAADVRIRGLDLYDMYKAACKVPAFKYGGIGLYLPEGFMHVDVRRKRARWGRENGKYVRFSDILLSLDVPLHDWEGGS